MNLDLSAADTKAARYKQYVENVRSLCYSADPKHQAMVRAANDGLTRLKALGPSAVHNDATLSNLSVQYANEEFIGDQLMPAIQVDKLSNKYFIYDKRNRLAYPDDAVGARSSANELSESRSTDNYSCVPYAYKEYLDVLTVANQDAPLNEMVDLVQSLNEAIAFRRELRIATVLTTSTNFATGNTASIAAGSRWDTAGGGNPIKDIQTGMAALWNGRGPSDVNGYCSLDVWNVLSRHPAVLDLFKYNGSSPGLATPAMLAGFLGMSKILVGKARKDTANDGQTASYSRVWSDVFGLARVARNPGVRTASFGYTFRFGAVQTDQWFDLSAGTKGGYYARVSTHEDHKVVANDTGYLISTPIG